MQKKLDHLEDLHSAEGSQTPPAQRSVILAELVDPIEDQLWGIER